MKKSKFITLVLVTALTACGSDKEKGHYQAQWEVKDSTYPDGRLLPMAVQRYYWVPVAGSPVEVTNEEFITNHTSTSRAVRGGFGSTGSAHSAEAEGGAGS